MHKHSSDELASRASAIMRGGNPMDQAGDLEDLAQRVSDMVSTAGKAAGAQLIKDHLNEFCAEAVSFAASVVSQADGPEDE